MMARLIAFVVALGIVGVIFSLFATMPDFIMNSASGLILLVFLCISGVVALVKAL